MSDDHNLNVDFKLISYKKRNKKTPDKIDLPKCVVSVTENCFDRNTAIRRICEAKEDIGISDTYLSVLALLRESQSVLANPEIKEIICLGLGRIGECVVSRYQLGLLLCLKDVFNVRVSVFDPVFTEWERSVLKELSCVCLTENLEGKYLANKTTLFYLPHCPKQLSNNLIWANWGLNLSNCIIIANSFSNILERNTRKVIQENAAYILSISSYVLELSIINTFKYYDIFNDLAVHVFPFRKLCLLPDDFWKYRDEPHYVSNDIEFITNKLSTL